MKTNLQSPPGESKINTRLHLQFPLKLALLLAALMLSPQLVRAVGQTWNNGSANFLWDASSLNWGGAAWTDGNDATFSATGAGNITISGTRTVGNITFNANGYTFGGGTLTLVNPSAAPTWNVNTFSTTMSNSFSMDFSSATAAGGVQKSGAGTLTYAGNINWVNNFTFLPVFRLNTGTIILTGTNSFQNTRIFPNGVNAKMIFSGGRTVSFGTQVSSGLVYGSVISEVIITNNSYVEANHFVIANSTNPGTNALTITSGTVTNSDYAGGYQMNNGAAPAATISTFNLNGGTCIGSKVSSVATYLGKAILNLNGGTFQAMTNQSVNLFTVLGQAGGTINVQANGAVIDSAGYSLTQTQPLLAGSPSGGLTKIGAGMLSLVGTNTYTGMTTINVGTLTGVTGGSCSNSAVLVQATSGIATLAARYTGSDKQWTCASVTTTAGGSGPALEFDFSSVPSTVNAPMNVTGNVTFTATPSVKVVLSGAGSLSAGTSYPLLTVGGTAPVTVPALTLVPPSFRVAYSANLSWGGAGNKTLFLNVTSVSSTEPLQWVGSGGAGTWDTNNAGNLVWKDNTASTTYYVDGDFVQFDEKYISADQAVQLDMAVTPASVLISNATYNYTISGAGTIGGSAPLTKTGNSNLVVGCALNTTGTLTNNGGMVQLTTGWPLTIGGMVGSGSTLDETINMLTVNLAGKTNTYTGSVLAYFPAANGIIGSGGHPFGLQVTNSGKLVLNGPITMAADDGTLPGSTVWFRISAYNAAEVDLGGTVTLTNVALRNNNTGITRVTGGSLALASTFTYCGILLQDSSQFIVDNGAISVPVASVGFGGSPTAGGCSLTINGGSLTVGAGNDGAGHNLGLEIGNNVTTNTTSTINLNGGVLSAVTIVDAPPADPSMTKSGTNVINFNGGTLLCASNNVIPTDLGVGDTNALQLRVGNGGAVINDGGYSQNLILPLQNNGSGGLTKLGSGTLTLNTNNTYVGATLVKGGTLALSNSATLASSLIGVTNGATFDVSGLSSTFALGAGQILSNSAASTGNLNGNLNATAGTISVSFAQGTPALTVANGALTLSAGTTFKVNNTGASLVAGTYPLITKGSGGSVAGTVPAVTLNIGGASGTASLTNSSGELDLVIASSAPSPTNIVVTTTGPNSLSLNWPAGQGWQLQSNSVSLVNTSAWQTVTGATPPYPVTISPNQTHVFYRLKY